MMNYKNIFLDKNFWSFIYRPILGCFSQGIAISVSLIFIWWLTGSFTGLRDALQSVKGMTIFFSIFLGALGNIGMLIVSLNSVKTYLFLTPIDSKLGSRDIKDYLSKKWNAEFFASLKLPLGLFGVSIIIFLIVYASGENWEVALLKSILYVLPFQAAGFVMYMINVLIQVILLYCRFIIKRGSN